MLHRLHIAVRFMQVFILKRKLMHKDVDMTLE